MKRLLLLLITGLFFSGCTHFSHQFQKRKMYPKYPKYPDYRGEYYECSEKTLSIFIDERGLGEFIACEDNTIQRNGPISSGRPKTHDTIRGNFRVQRKYQKYDSKKYPSENGGRNMDYANFFHRGFAIHKGNIRGLSHGCIRTREQDAKWIYNWTNIGTKVIVK